MQTVKFLSRMGSEWSSNGRFVEVGHTFFTSPWHIRSRVHSVMGFVNSRARCIIVRIVNDSDKMDQLLSAPDSLTVDGPQPGWVQEHRRIT